MKVTLDIPEKESCPLSKTPADPNGQPIPGSRRLEPEDILKKLAESPTLPSIVVAV